MAGAARSLSPQPLRTSHCGTPDVEVIDAKCATVVRTGPLVLTQGTDGRPYEGPCLRSWLGRESRKGISYLWSDEVSFVAPELVYVHPGSRGSPGESGGTASVAAGNAQASGGAGSGQP